MGDPAEFRVAGRSEMLRHSRISAERGCTGHKPSVMLGVLIQVFSCDVVAQSLGRERKFDIARVASFSVSIDIWERGLRCYS